MKIKKSKVAGYEYSVSGSPFSLKTPLKPLLASAGGKSKCLKFLKSTIPIGSKYSAYVEPFFSTGGALFSDMVNSSVIQEIRINDNCPERISLLNAIKSYPYLFIAKCEGYAEEWNDIEDEEDRKTWYYEKRAEYQTMKIKLVSSMALYYVLQRLSFSGIYRTNKITNRFYGAVGHRNRLLRIDQDLILEWSRELQNAQISCGDYKAMKMPIKPALIFCDPPYRKAKIGFGYTFGDKELVELIKWCEDMSNLGHTVLLTNLDDDFIKSKIKGHVETHYLDIKFTAGRTNQLTNRKKLSKLCCFVFKPIRNSAANDDSYNIMNTLLKVMP